jgi:hypothetical protein
MRECIMDAGKPHPVKYKCGNCHETILYRLDDEEWNRGYAERKCVCGLPKVLYSPMMSKQELKQKIVDDLKRDGKLSGEYNG